MANSPKTICVTNDALAKEIEDSGKALIDLGMRLRRGFEVPIEYKAYPATAPEPAAPSVVYCGATNPESETYIPCMLDSGHDGNHWSTSGCSGGAVEWPEHAALSDEPTDAELLSIAQTAQLAQPFGLNSFAPVLRAVFEAGRKHERGER